MESTTEKFNTILDTAIPEDAENKYLTFFCDKQIYAVSILHVVQIVGIQEITPIPQAPDYSKGIINLRGSVIAVIDTRLRLKKAECPYDERTCIIIATIDQTEVGFIVDGVDEVLKIEPDSITEPAKTTGHPGSRFVTGIANEENKIILILDVKALFATVEPEATEQL